MLVVGVVGLLVSASPFQVAKDPSSVCGCMLG